MLKTLLFLSIFNLEVEKDTIPLIDSKALLIEVAECNKREAYEESIDLLEQISIYDTNYHLVPTQLIYAYGKNEELEKAAKLGDSLMHSGNELSASFYITYGNAFVTNDLPIKAEEVYRSGLALYPYNYVLLYNIGYVLYDQGKYQEAVHYLQESLKLNPFYHRPHSVLAEIMAKSNQRSKAVLGYLTYLALDPESNRVLVKLNELLNDAYREEGSIDLNIDNTFFTNFDNLLKSKAAFDDRFKSSVDFEAPVVQQSELLIRKLKYTSQSNDFWMDFYVPMFEEMKKESLIEAFLYFILYSTEDEGARAWVNKHKDETENWVSVASDYLEENQKYQKRIVMGDTGVYYHWYHDNNYLSSIGNIKGGNAFGPFSYYHENGRLKAHGRYNENGEKIGKWFYYHDNGQLETEESYDENGKIHGTLKQFDRNGSISLESEYEDGKLNGVWKSFYPCGTIREEYPYVDGVGTGEGKYYYNSGGLNVKYTIEDNKANGAYTYFHQNGEVANQSNFSNDKREGEFVSFYPDGAKYEIGNYKSGKSDGVWKIYHQNGNLSAEGSFNDDEYTGEWHYFYDNGNNKRLESFNEQGEHHGPTIWYDWDGILHSTREYKNGLLVSYEFYDKHGKKLVSERNESGTMPHRRFYSTGELEEEGQLVNGKLEGPFKLYHVNGIVKKEGTMKNDSWHGSFKEYDISGVLKIAGHYEEGALTGYYQAYHENGNLKHEGWLNKGDINQQWHEYHMNGTMSERLYFRDGKKHGRQEEFDMEGRIQFVEYYNNGIYTSIEMYDTLGNVFHSADIPEKGGNLTLKYPDGSKYKDATYTCGKIVEDTRYYFKNGKLSARYNVKNAQVYYYEGYNSEGFATVKGNYLDDERHGEWAYYFDNGKLDYKAEYKDGEKHGKSYDYYENGQLASECDKLAGENHGKCIFYDPSGAIMGVKYYHIDSRIIGYQSPGLDASLSDTIHIDNTKDEFDVNTFYPNGKPAIVSRYWKTYYEGENLMYAMNGTLLSRINYKNGARHGLAEEFWPNGNQKSTVNYEFGERNGVEEEYYESGKLKASTTWLFGNKNGWYRKYEQNGNLVEEKYYRNDMEY